MAEALIKLGRKKAQSTFIDIDKAKELPPEGGNYPVVNLWTLICLSMGVLGPNEREYLGEDLKEVNVFHPETAM
ncbi:MAG: hypothetical protein ACNA7H_03465 [Desulfotignum sp.]